MGIKCYRTGGCGPYEMYSCHECPANNPVYKCLKECGHIEICKSHILTGHILSCPSYSDLSKYIMNKKTAVPIPEEKKKVKVIKMKKNIPSKAKEEKEDSNSCPVCTLKEYKSKTKFSYSFTLDFFRFFQDEEELKVALCKDNKTNEWFIYISYHDEDYDLREINREFSIPIKCCPICGRELK